jgi:hypothetical protein
LVGAIVAAAGGLGHAANYPLTATMDAQVKSGATTITTQLVIHVDRLMEESRRVRVTDALKYGGYANFLNTLRALPPVGHIQLEKRKAEIRYAREQGEGDGNRLILVADSPLFFLGDATKPRAGYELTIVELRFDAQGGVSGTISGAARVKPAGEDVVLDDFAEAPLQIKGRLTP